MGVLFFYDVVFFKDNTEIYPAFFKKKYFGGGGGGGGGGIPAICSRGTPPFSTLDSVWWVLGSSRLQTPPTPTVLPTPDSTLPCVSFLLARISMHSSY